MIQESRKDLNTDNFVWPGNDPPHLEEWVGNKRLDFERKKMIKLYQFFKLEKERMGENPDGYPRVYLRDWAPAEIQLFDEYMNKLI
jgi:hypothetical protein